MVNKNAMIPWESEDDWSQVVLSIGKAISVVSAKGSEIKRLRTLAGQIVQDYVELEIVMEKICGLSCSVCLDVCCRKATVWYDLKDLLVVYLNTGALPGRQIYKRPGYSCSNLTSSGCRLIRSDRPFICTWYICPDQKNIIARLPDGAEKLALFRTVDKIKTARRDLESEYVKAICSK